MLSWRHQADIRLSAAACEGTGGPEVKSSQGAGQLVTRHPSNQPAARLCSSALQRGLKMQHGDHVYQWLKATLFTGIVVRENWRDDCTPSMFYWVEGCTWIRDKCVIKWLEQRSRAVCMIGIKLADSFNWVGVTRSETTFPQSLNLCWEKLQFLRRGRLHFTFSDKLLCTSFL